MQAERHEFGVQPTSQLHGGAMNGPTPASIPGGQVVTTKGLVALVQNRPMPFAMLDAGGGGEALPGAVSAAQAAQPGSFSDAVQKAFVQQLQQQTGGNKQMPLVVYGQSMNSWLAYHAAHIATEDTFDWLGATYTVIFASDPQVRPLGAGWHEVAIDLIEV